MLSLHDLRAGYRNQAVVQLAELKLSKGEAALILGPSGVGKTTLLLAMAGLARVFSGAIMIDGAVITSMSGSEKDRLRGRAIGFVFQDLHLIAGLSALDNVLLAPFASGAKQDKARALSLLSELNLADLAHRRAETLSRGQAQRIAIARAMLTCPNVLLADEPTASLDDEACETVCALLLRAAAETGAALVIATHDGRLKARIPRVVVAGAAT
jgi:putative ABC transport system ATP-binding protein